MALPATAALWFLVAAAWAGVLAAQSPPPPADAAPAVERGWIEPNDVAFTASVEASERLIASVEVAPGGSHLYAVTLAGDILRWEIDPQDGSLGASQTLSLPHFTDPEGRRGLVGLAFDPQDPLTLWISDNFPVALWGSTERRPDFSGRVSRVRLAPGTAFEGEAQTYVRGLPRSCGDHVSNSLRFRPNPDPGPGAPAHLLYLSQGSNSAMGAADKAWCFRPERLLSAAILEIDPTREPPPGGFDVATEPLPQDGGNRRFGYSWRIGPLLWSRDDSLLKAAGIPIDSGPHAGAFLHFGDDGVASVRAGADASSALKTRYYDPFSPGAPVRIHATGIRNAYDLVWHSNGWLYAPSNGPVAGGATPDDPATPPNEAVSPVGRTEDFLLRIGRGEYSGHPNPLRGEFIAHGGNPTAGPDVNEVSAYPVGVKPDPRYRPERAHALGYHWSPNGAVEYRDASRGPALQGALIVANFSRGNNLRAITFDAAGDPAEDFTLRDPQGAEITFADPLDIAAGPDGRLYLSTLERSNGKSLIVRLEPASALIEQHAQ
jgi:hypothetical protein